MKYTVGRPPVWETPEVLQKLVDDYFVHEEKPTLSGLAYALGVSRSTIWEYGEKDQFSIIIKRARDYVQSFYEERLLFSNLPTGVIFALKNMGWKDRSDVTSDDKAMPTPIYGGKATE